MGPSLYQERACFDRDRYLTHAGGPQDRVALEKITVQQAVEGERCTGRMVLTKFACHSLIVWYLCTL